MKKFILIILSILAITSCQKESKIIDERDMFVGTYRLNIEQDITWGYDSKHLIYNDEILKISKVTYKWEWDPEHNYYIKKEIISNRMYTDGYFTTGGEFINNMLFLESTEWVTSTENLKSSYSVITSPDNGNTILFTIQTNGNLLYKENSRIYPYQCTETVVGTKISK